MNGLLWKLARGKWRKGAAARAPGYTALVAVPGDLPVFTKIALGTINAQDNAGLVETLVIPDMGTSAFEAAFEEARRTWSNGPVRVVKLRAMEQFITRRINSPHTNHWLQMINGVEAANSTHALMHDADLFITDRTFLAKHYAAMARRPGLACLGVNAVWDKWYAENRLGHVAATWELMFDVEWARSYRPFEHRGHWGEVAGKRHEFDTMLWPQSMTAAERVDRHRDDWGFVHFNYVICTYRWFKESKGIYEDSHWRILLIRLLVDAYGSTETEEDVPSLGELKKGLSGDGRVDYRGEAARKNYAEFRGKLGQLMESGVLDEGKVGSLKEGVAPFDAAMGWEESRILRSGERSAVRTLQE